MSAPAPPPVAGGARPDCANCGTALVGAFCHACGQERGPGAVTIRALVADVADEVLSMDGLLPRVMFVLLPAFAVLLHGLQRRRTFAEHFVFALHFHTAAFVIATVHILLAPLTTSTSALRAPAIAIDAGVQLYLLLYLFLAQRVVYGGPWPATLLKTALLLAGYAAALLLALVGLIRLLRVV